VGETTPARILEEEIEIKDGLDELYLTDNDADPSPSMSMSMAANIAGAKAPKAAKAMKDDKAKTKTGKVIVDKTQTKSGKSKSEKQYGDLPDISDLIETAYPTWCIDESETRITDVDTCADGTPNGRFTPLYFTKQHSGGNPDLGGYPTNIDINYAFEYAAPYYGQACAGSPHQCSEDFDGSKDNCHACPKIETKTDDGPYGPGHVPPHSSLDVVTKAYNDGFGGDVADWFQHDLHACRIIPSVLFKLLRNYYPRNGAEKVGYPPPFSVAGGSYPLEFVNVAGESCTKETEKHGEIECFEQHSGDVALYPEYLLPGHGSPHYCTKEGKAAGLNNDYCPYIFFGPNRGKYRHPHIAFSALEVYLANKVMPDKCEITWDDSKYPAEVDTTVSFPDMGGEYVTVDGLKAPEQPIIADGLWIWPGPDGDKKKPVVGNFATNLHIVATEATSVVAVDTVVVDTEPVDVVDAEPVAEDVDVAAARGAGVAVASSLVFALSVFICA